MARTTIEKKSFSDRLKQSLQNANYSPNSPSQLARQFNSRFPGPPISSEAARKWLAAETFPTEEKLLTIAKWLDVSPDWLRFNILKQDNVSDPQRMSGTTGISA